MTERSELLDLAQDASSCATSPRPQLRFWNGTQPLAPGDGTRRLRDRHAQVATAMAWRQGSGVSGPARRRVTGTPPAGQAAAAAAATARVADGSGASSCMGGQGAWSLAPTTREGGAPWRARRNW